MIFVFFFPGSQEMLILLLLDMLDFQGCVFEEKILSIAKGPGPSVHAIDAS